MSFLLLALLTGILVIVTLIPLSRYQAWWIRDLDFPRLQIALGAAFLLAAELALLDLTEFPEQSLLALTLACLVYQAWWIIPYTPVFPKEVKSAVTNGSRNKIRIMAANVLGTNHDADALLALVRMNNPDILVTLESDHWWQVRLDTLEPDYPHTMKCPLDNLYGMHVYSKLALEDPAIQFLVEPDVPSMHAMVVLPTSERIRMHFLHPAPPSPTENEASTERDAELLVVAKSVAQIEGPIIVAGDLNDVAWSETTRLFRKISGLLDPRIGRGMCNTFHADHWFIRWPLDHLFHSKHFTLSFIKRLPKFGSDHFAVVVELSCEAAHGKEQEGLEADQADIAEADEKIREESVSVSDVHEPTRR